MYERFGPQTPAGAADATRGIRQFTVGTGGQGTEGFTTAPLANSEVRFTGVYGVLQLTLEADRYSWEFVPIAGQTASERGSRSCH